MESVINNRSVYSSKTALDEFFEQKVDIDIILPDYCPAVGRILKCDVKPAVMSKTIDGDKLLLEIQSKSTVIYVDEQNNIHSVTKTESFSKTLMLKAELSISKIRTVTRAMSVNCRIQNSRKISIKSTIGTAVKIMGCCECEIIDEAKGGGIESSFEKNIVNIICATGESGAHVSGQLAVGAAVAEIITSNATVRITDKKIMTDKILVKGEVGVSVVYITGEGTDSFSFFEGTVPFSEVVDVFGADENSSCEMVCEVQNIQCEIVDDDGTIGCDIDVSINVCAYTETEINLLKDIYSMYDKLNTSTTELVLESYCKSIDFLQNVSGSIACDFSEARIKGVCAEGYVKNIGLSDGNFTLEGDIAVTVYMCNDEDYSIIEKAIPFCLTHPVGDVCDNMRCEALVDVVNLSYSMPNDDEIIVSAELNAHINCFARQTYNAIDSVEIGDSLTDGCKGVVLYYAEKGERLWDIAKKYRSSVSIIKSYNKLDSDALDSDKPLLICYN